MTKDVIDTGTASVTNGTKTVTFSGVSVSLFAQNDRFIQGGNVGVIDSVDAVAGTATLTQNWPGTTSSAAIYTVVPGVSDEELAVNTRTLMQYIGGPLLTIAAMTGDAFPANGSLLVAQDGDWEALASTGTGAVVRETSPTLVTPALGAATADSLSVSGRVLVGDSADWLFGGAAASVKSGAATSYGLSMWGQSTGSTARTSRIDSTSSWFDKFFYGDNVFVGSMTTDGTGVTVNTSSDRRLKSNIQDAGDSGVIIDGLKARQWDWNSNGAHEAFGFVAQEEIEVAPFAVTRGDDDPETISRQWQRNDTRLIPVMVKELQLLRQRMAAVEAA